MPKFSVQVPHALTQEQARARLDRFADVLGERFRDQVSDFAQKWEGDALRFRFKTFGIPLSGRILVNDGTLDLDGDLPFSAVMFKGKIESSIRDELAKMLAAEE
jgi:putative polyhydroxyalkanoate system protein